MAYYAQLNENNDIIQVICINDIESPTEEAGISFCKSLYGSSTQWVETSLTDTKRKRYTGIGEKYDPLTDSFVAKPLLNRASWVLNNKNEWVAPIPKPNNSNRWYWDELNVAWSATKVN